MDIKGNSKKSFLILMLIPLVALVAYGIRYNQNIFDYYLPNSQWNDEVIYYKSIEGILEYGMPKGYFGYNESHAKWGNLGAWSPYIYFFDVLWGRIINWNYYAPIVARIVFAILGFVIYGICRKPSYKDCFFIGLFVTSFSLFSRYMVSNMADHYITILFVILIALIYNRHYDEKKFAILIPGIIVFLSLMRPYMVIMWLITLENNRNSISKMVRHGVLAITSIIVYFVSSYYMSASYFTPLIKTAWIENIISSPIAGIKLFFGMILDGLKSSFEYGKAAFVYGDDVGLQYVIFILFTVIFLLLSLKKDNKIEHLRWIAWVAVNVLLWFAIVLLYDFRVGSRHIMPFIVVEGILIIEELKTSWKVPIILFVAYLCLVRFQDPYVVDYPQYSEKMEKTITDMGSKISNTIDDGVDPWDFTLIWVLSDSEGMFPWQTLYGTPPGMGINICTCDYVTSNIDTLSARYIACNKSGNIFNLCELNNYDELYSSDYYGVSIYKRY